MIQKHRISTNIGSDQLINVEITQDYDLLEILSLKFTQQDVYASGNCSDYGVVVGRLTVNNGFGVPNAKISIFIPLDSVDENDPVISSLYPYKVITDKDNTNHRYNLLPAKQQHGGHQPTGTFFDQEDIITREEYLEVFEKYYKYTVKTNSAGDFMIWGVPIGSQTIHVDVDLSDIGCFSLRPDDFIRTGYGVDEFKSTYQFKASEDLDSLPQIKSFDKSIEVYPLWGNQDLCQIGITRTDFDLSSQGVKIQPKSLIIGGTVTDTGKNSINKNCLPSKHMGAKCTLSSVGGKIESIRFTVNKDELNRPILEEHDLNEDIFEDGSFAFSLPMNMDYIYTNEFGDNEYTNDPNKGIPTSACYRLRFTLKDEGEERVRMRASYLVPNIREIYTGTSVYDDVTVTSESNKSYAWSLNYDDYPVNGQDLILNVNDGFYYPQDYFYRFHYGKVYTVSSFHGTTLHEGFLTSNRYLGIKEIMPPEEKDCGHSVLTPPANFATKNTGFNFTLLLSIVLTFIQYIFALIKLMVYEFVGSLFYQISKVFDSVKGISYHFAEARDYFWNLAYRIQEGGQFTLPLTIYDDCELCTTDDGTVVNAYNPNDYCKIGELMFNIVSFSGDPGNTYFQVVGVSETGSSNINGNGFSRDCNDPSVTGCCGSYMMSTDGGGSGFFAMNSLTTEYGFPRFLMDIGSSATLPINEVVFNIFSPRDDNANQHPIVPLPGDFLSPAFVFTDQEMSDMFGINNAHDYFSGTTPVNVFVPSGAIIVWGYVVDQNYPKTDISNQQYTGTTVEEGCLMYDTLYDERIITDLLWFSGDTQYGNSYEPVNPDNLMLNNTISPGIIELPVVDPSNLKSNRPSPDCSIGASVFYKSGQSRLPRVHKFNWISTQTYNRRTKTGYSEFRDGVFTVVPSISGISNTNARGIREWYRRQLVGINFCGGVVNHAFIDNWLSGVLYFFQFKGKIKDANNVKYCQESVKYDISSPTGLSNGEIGRFYYKSCPYNPITDTWGIINQNNSQAPIKLLHPTTFVDLGPRDEFIKEICLDQSLDPNCSVSRSIGSTSFKSFGELIAFAINYRMDVTNDAMNTDGFFNNSGFIDKFGGIKVFDGDIMQLISINSETGIEGFDLQNPKYLGYSISTLDPEDNKNVFQNGTGVYGPVPITLDYETDGVRIRQCLNTPPRLTESAQKVPFFLWNKGANGFGPYSGSTLNSQAWDYLNVHVDYLQGMTYGYRYTGSVNDSYLLPPISYDFTGQTIQYNPSGLAEEFDVVVMEADSISDDYQKTLYNDQFHKFTLLIATGGTISEPTGGRLYIRLGEYGQWTDQFNWNTTFDYTIYPTTDPYITSKQILSTPFMFYFGLRPGNTGLDKLIARFGPKGAFPPPTD